MQYDRKYEPFFQGSPYDFASSIIPERVVDRIIELLGLNPSDPATLSPQWDTKSLLWSELAGAIWRLGKPSPSSLGSTPKQVHNHATALTSQLNKTIKMLEGLEYASMYECGGLSKEYIVGKRIRHVSEQLAAREQGRAACLVANLCEAQDYENTGAWGKYCPFDYELEETLLTLKKISKYFEEVEAISKVKVKDRGVLKSGKIEKDGLISLLCNIYFLFTGDDPIPIKSHEQDRDMGIFTKGQVVPFLQLVLPYSFYTQSLMDTALQSRIERLAKNPAHRAVMFSTRK